MFTTAQTADVLGVSPGRVRQMLATRDGHGYGFLLLPLVEQLSSIPDPVNAAPQLFDEWQVLRTRAYREGGGLARRVELAAWEDVASDRGGAVRHLELLRYPAHDPNFVDWILDTINTEVSGGAL